MAAAWNVGSLIRAGRFLIKTSKSSAYEQHSISQVKNSKNVSNICFRKMTIRRFLNFFVSDVCCVVLWYISYKTLGMETFYEILISQFPSSL